MTKLTKYSAIAGSVAASLLPITVHAMGMNGDDGASAAGGAAAGVLVFFMLLMLVIWVGVILLWVFWLVMIIDIAKRDWKNDGDRAAYLVLVIFLNIIGALIYYFAVKKHLDHKDNKPVKK